MRFLGRRRWLFATVLGAALAAPITAAQAQTGKLTGVVTDTESGKPVEGAAVIIQGTTLGATTNAAGRYFIIQVPPGTYTVQARRLGYQSVNATSVVLTIDQTTDQNFKLRSSNQTLAAVTVQAEQVPLVQRGQVGSQSVVTAEAIQSLPVTSIAGVLALQQGYVEVPQSTNLITVAEEQRGTTPAPRVRGSRGGATLSMIDNIPINNPLFGTNVVNLSPFAVQQVSFNRGYMDPQYGNALSGVINQAVREGGSEVSGAIDYQNSQLAGNLFNNVQDKLLGLNLLRGYLSGPVPGTGTKVRYAISGEVSSQASSVLKFDDDVLSVNAPLAYTDQLLPDRRDLASGWGAFGGRQSSNVVGKVTFLPLDNTSIKFTAIASDQSSQGYDRRNYFLYRGDPLKLVNNRADSLYVLADGGNRLSRDMVQSTGRNNGAMFIGSLDQRFGRTNVSVRVAQSNYERTTCPVFLGTCLPSPFYRPNFSQGFLSPSTGVGGGDRIPDAGGVGLRYGGEDVTTRVARVDVQSQVTDHNNLQFGVMYTKHDLKFKEIQGFGTNSGIQPFTTQVYNAKPYEAAGYIQSTIEYDFIKISLGGRFDYGVASGKGFTDPFNPTNGTTAREICTGTEVAGRKLVNAQGQPLGLAGCSAGPINPLTQRSVFIDTAVAIAQLDDFTDAKARTSFSPRIGISFPLSEKSQLFFNAGRYTMIPLYGNVYRNTGVGTVAGQDGYCAAGLVKPGTNECQPNLSTNNPEFVGNPNLLLEEAKSYEIGYSSELGRNYSIQVNVFNRSETGLSGIRPGRAVQDIGSTYEASLPVYTALVNGDFLTSRGVEIQFRRRLADRWGYDVSYGLSRATSNSRPPERANEIQRQGEASRQQLLETVADINIPHNFLTSVNVQFRDNDAPKRLGLDKVLRNTNTSLTYTYRSGVPYTPIAAASFGAITNVQNLNDINAGQQPSNQQVNFQFSKNFRIANVAYSGFLRVDNLLDRKNCVQVFVNTGTCDAGLRDFNNRSVGNTGDASTSTAFDQPEYIGPRRSIAAGIRVSF